MFSTDNLQVSLLSSLLDESQINDLILKAKDYPSLKLALWLKAESVKKDANKRILYPIESILSNLNAENAIELQCLLRLALQIQTDWSQLILLIEYINSNWLMNVDNLEFTTLLFNVVFETVAANREKFVLEEHLNDNSILDVLKLITSDAKYNKYNLTITKYLNVCQNVNMVLQELWENIKEYKNLIALCSLEEWFFDFLKLHKRKEFWLLLRECFDCVESPLKVTLYLMRKAFDILLQDETPDETDGVITYRPNRIEDVALAWRNLCLILEIAREKQLHLVEPALVLLPSLHDLNPGWLLCVYKSLLSHTQSIIVYKTLTKMLQDVWYKDHYFLPASKLIVDALNRNEFFEEHHKLIDDLEKFCLVLSESQFDIFFGESLERNWVPGALWFFYKGILSNRGANLLNHWKGIVNQLEKLPQKVIRNGLIKSLIFHLSRHKAEIPLDLCVSIIKLIGNNDHVLEYLNFHCPVPEWQLMKLMQSADLPFIKLLLTLWDKQTREKDLLGFLETEVCTPVTDEIFSYLMLRNKDDALMNRYFLKRLHSESDCSSDLNIKIDSLNENQIDEIILMRIGDIMKNPGGFKPGQVKFALNIVSKIEPVTAKNLLETTGRNFFLSDLKYVCGALVEVFAKSYLKCSGSDEEVMIFIRNLLEKEDLLIDVIRMMPFLTQHMSCDETRLELLNLIYEEVISSKKSPKFRDLLEQFTVHIVLCLTPTGGAGVMSLPMDLFRSIVTLSKTHDFAAGFLASSLKARFHHLFPEDRMRLIEIIVDLILSCDALRKCDKLEYMAIKDALRLPPPQADPPNLNWSLDTKFCIIMLLYKNMRTDSENFFNVLTRTLIQRYRKNLGKRYFPRSQLHFEKLRTVQVLGMIYSKTAIGVKEKLAEFLLECINQENHQGCVRQLIQFLLVELLLHFPDMAFGVLNEIARSDCTKHVAKIVTYLPIVYRLILRTTGRSDFGLQFYMETVDLLLKLTMGPQFKIRLYSQMALLKILQNPPSTISDENLYAVLKAAKAIVKETGERIHLAVKTDQVLFALPKEHEFSLRDILIAIPALNAVPEHEYNILKSLFGDFDDERIVYSEIESMTPKLHHILSKIAKKTAKDPELAAGLNVQKKITSPALEEQIRRCVGDLIVVASLVNSSANIGGLTRTCEIYGVKQLVVHDKKMVDDKEFKSLSMSSEGWMDIHEVKEDDLFEYLEGMKGNKYRIVGVEQTADSVALNTYGFVEKTVLLLGNEKQGIHPKLLQLLDDCVEIPQYGFTRSLNVHVAGAIFMWEYVKQYSMKYL